MNAEPDAAFLYLFTFLTPCFAVGLMSSLWHDAFDDAQVIGFCWACLAIAFLYDRFKATPKGST